MNRNLIVFILVGISCYLFTDCSQKEKTGPKRFFSNDSFWNTPLPGNPAIDPRNDFFIGLLKTEPTGNNFGINTTKYTIPVYEADENTKRVEIHFHYLSDNEKKNWATTRERFGHGPGFGEDVPIPENATPDPEQDSHFAVVDWQNMVAWDMWGLRKRPDGSWESNTGMKYRLDGDGVFKTKDFEVIDGESIHFHGPSRAAGVPAIAGLILYDEVMAGEIRHKLACATRFNAYKEFTFPAAWTDGHLDGGIPEGAVIQLNPDLDLSLFDLLPGELVVARALQKYGMVIVDNAGGSTLYAEGLWGHPDKSWDGVLRDWDGGINTIPVEHFRVLKIGEITHMGDGRWKTYN